MRAPSGYDWGGKLEPRFRWKTFRTEWGRWYYKTNAFGDTLAQLWQWENP